MMIINLRQQGMKSGRKLRRKSRSIANLAMAEDDETENHVSIGAADDSHLTPLKRRVTKDYSNGHH
jgi:hypothetical protein